MKTSKQLSRIRTILLLFIICLFLSGLTAIPVVPQLKFLLQYFPPYYYTKIDEFLGNWQFITNGYWVCLGFTLVPILIGSYYFKNSDIKQYHRQLVLTSTFIYKFSISYGLTYFKFPHFDNPYPLATSSARLRIARYILKQKIECKQSQVQAEQLGLHQQKN